MRAAGTCLLQQTAVPSCDLKFVLLKGEEGSPGLLGHQVWLVATRRSVGFVLPLWRWPNEFVRHPLFVLELAKGGDCGSRWDEDAVISIYGAGAVVVDSR